MCSHCVSQVLHQWCVACVWIWLGCVSLQEVEQGACKATTSLMHSTCVSLESFRQAKQGRGHVVHMYS
jgi:hypothetical protein